MVLFGSMLSRLIGVAIAVGAISSTARAQTLRLTSPEAGGTQELVPDMPTGPTTAVRVLVPCPVGSPADIFARRLAQILAESSGRQFYVENVAGNAGNLVAAQEVQLDANTVLFGPADPTLPSACGD